MRLPITLHKNYTLNGICIQQSLTTELLIRNQQNRFWYAWEKWINFEAVVGIFKEEFKINQTVHGILLDFEKKGDTTITFIEKGKLFAASVLEKLYEMEENAMQRLSHDQRNQLVICSTKYYELLKEEIEHGPYIMN